MNGPVGWASRGVDVLQVLTHGLGGRYKIERQLGSGGMAAVYLGEDLKHHRRVAIKVLHPQLASHVGLARFRREIATAASLAHPHILPLHDSGEVGGLAYYVMPYVEGETLRERLTREPQLPVHEVLTLAREIADGLEYAHRHDCVHRDIKPENILLSDGHALLADFGVARAITVSAEHQLTSSGLVIGTPAYMSPEQAGGEAQIDGRSDIYALGCVVYEALAGEPPFTGPTAQAIIAKHMVEPPPSLTVVRPGTPAHVVQAVVKALAKRPADRYAHAAQFAEALSAPVRRRPWRRALAASLVVATLAFAVALTRLAPFASDSGYSVDQPRQTFIVLPHRTGRADPEAEALAQDAESELSRLLSGWAEARAVPAVARAGLLFDLGFTDPVRTSLRESIALAREARVGTLVTLTARILGDSAFLEAQLYDVSTAEPLGAEITTAAPKSDLFALVAPVAADIFEFSGASTQLASFRRESRNLEAIRAVQEGRHHLERWRLERAERSFRFALQQDSMFARAHYLLALTLYWQAARDVQRFPQLGGEIRRHASAARRYGASLVYRDSVFTEAFYHFQNGDFPRARMLYNELIRSDSTDTYAWLLLGSVEYQDFWAEEDSGAVMRPRGNLNLARRAFTRTVRLSPDFFLGYGHLFDIYARLSGALRSGTCYGYQPPSDRTILMWETRDPKEQVYRCPVLRDSIEWVEADALATLDERHLLAGAQRFLDEAMVELRRWSAYAPDDPQPEEELAAWLLARRELVPRTAPPSAWDSLAAEALRHTERAVARKRDTTPEDLVRLGGLYLATGEVGRALLVTVRAVDALEPDDGGAARPVPAAAANVFLATGQVARAVPVVVHQARQRRMTVWDSLEERHHDVRAGEVLARLRVYGATAVRGSTLHAAFGDLERTWTRAGYGAHQTRVIRRAVTRWIRPALALDHEVMTYWFAGWEPRDPALAGLLVSRADSAAARRHLQRGARELEARFNAPATVYLLGVLAQRLGDHQQAITLFERLDRWPLDFQTVNEAWGLRSLSHLWRARSYETIGDSAASRRHYARFFDLWNDADAELTPLLEEARAGLARQP